MGRIWGPVLNNWEGWYSQTKTNGDVPHFCVSFLKEIPTMGPNFDVKIPNYGSDIQNFQGFA